MSDNKNVDDELQKAIDDINKTTSVDPMFSDPIAAPSTIPEGDTGEMGEPVGPFPAPEPEINLPEPPAPAVPEAPAPAPIDPTTGLNVNQIKEAALRDLLPLVDKLNLGPKERFDLYCDAFKELRDYAVLEPAYLSAREIANEQERAEALLYVINTIKNM